jgi:DNA repair protein RadC
VKDLGPADRPREKLVRHGVKALGDNELVALVIGSGSGKASALAVANGVLKEYAGLYRLARAGVDELALVAGIGLANAARIVAAVELGRRTLACPPDVRARLGTPHEAAAYLLPAFGSRAVEQFGVVLLDTRHRAMRTTIVAAGTLNTTIVEPRDVYREAMLGGASAIVVFHNHPSGDPRPSPDDEALTRRLVAAGAIMGIDLVDHIVLGDTKYCSFKEMGLI